MTDSVRRIAEALFVERMKNDYFSAVTQTEWREIATACVQKAQELEDALGADKPEAKPKLETVKESGYEPIIWKLKDKHQQQEN